MRWALLIALIGLLSINLFGQAETAQITGTVYDPSGAAIPNATVTVKSVDTGAVREATTSATGAYIATDLLPGDYVVSATAPGFIQIQQRVTASVGAKLAVDLRLQVGQASTVVEVNASAIQVNTETQTLSTVVNQTELRELPTVCAGRHFGECLRWRHDDPRSRLRYQWPTRIVHQRAFGRRGQ
jgi:hypothetical protein